MPSFIRIMGGGPNESSRGEDSESPLKNYKKLPDTQDIGCWKKISKWKWCLVLNLTTTREFWANYDLFHPASWKRIFLNFHIFFVSCWISKFALWRCYLNEFVFSFYFAFVLFLSLYLSSSLSFCWSGFVSSSHWSQLSKEKSLQDHFLRMSPRHSDQMSERSPVSRIALWRCSQNVLVLVVVVVVFVFVFVFFVRSSAGSLFEGVL